MSDGCVACGACCFSKLESYVAVTGADYARIGEDADTLVQFIGNKAYMRMSDGHCEALVVQENPRSYSCAIYADRPAPCRDLAEGSMTCAAEREAKHDRPGRALVVVR